MAKFKHWFESDWDWDTVSIMATASAQTIEEEKTFPLRELSYRASFVCYLLPSGAQDGVLFKLFTQGKPS